MSQSCGDLGPEPWQPRRFPAPPRESPAAVGGRHSLLRQDPGRGALRLLRVAQQHPARGRDGEQAEGRHGGPAEGGPVDDEDHGDEQAAEGGPAHDVTRRVVLVVSGGVHGRVNGRGEGRVEGERAGGSKGAESG